MSITMPCVSKETDFFTATGEPVLFCTFTVTLPPPFGVIDPEDEGVNNSGPRSPTR
jgi:hypothetical protein